MATTENLDRKELIDPGPDRILGTGHTYETVTDRISGIVYLPWKKAPKKWMVGAFFSFCFVNLLMLAMYVLFVHGIGVWGVNIPDRVGIRDRQFRLVDRYRPRGDFDFGDSVPSEAGLAHLDQPVFGSDDAFCGSLRGDVPDFAPGAAVAGVLALPVSEFDVVVAAAAQSARMGRIRGFDVWNDIAGVLVLRPDSRFREHAR